ncbi:MAG: Dabb family protein [Planctomycetes bacterium]|nr:Dabb family protein [Planctomycetota bacterium]
MLSHDVYFTLKDRSPEAAARLVATCKRYLSGHPGTLFFAVGTLEPELARPVNDRDFDVALHVVFKDRASHDLYQKDPRHHQFIAEEKASWERVRVFDSIVEGV